MNARSVLVIVVAAIGLSSPPAGAQHHAMATATAKSDTPPPIRTTMEALHRNGGVPPGWRFLMPPGNATAGRKVFATMECSRCHVIRGDGGDAAAAKKAGDVGPELTGMGNHHSAEYFAESIANPNRVIVEGPGYTGPDGLSIMPDYSETLTIRELTDLVAYLKSLTTIHAGGHAGHSMPMKDR